MFNFLVTSMTDAWDLQAYEYDKSRFLEYTTSDIASKFQRLTSNQVEILKSYPCLFAYEGNDQEIRAGKLTNIITRDKTIVIEFELNKDVKPFTFNDLKGVASLMDIRQWEMNRTHWAIKDANLYECLLKAGLIPIKNRTIRKISERTDLFPEPDIEEMAISSVQELIEMVLSDPQDNTREIFYRGHSDKTTYKLEPSIFRKDANGNYLYMENEHILYRELLVSNSADFSTDDHTLDRLVRMQHYSLPTRLLDITSNPLIALYFACKSKDSGKQNIKGEVVIISIKKDEIKYFDSDTVSCIANLARLSKSEKEKIDFNQKKFHSQIPVKRLTHFIKEEKSFFEERILPSDLKRIICVKGKKSNDRISSQSGAFLIFGHESTLLESGNDEIQIKRITISDKNRILHELDMLNINESTVFPYIENSARYIANKFSFGK